MMITSINDVMAKVEDNLFIDSWDVFSDRVREYEFEVKTFEDIKSNVDLDNIFCKMLGWIDLSYEFDFGKIELHPDLLYDEFINKFYEKCALLLNIAIEE